MPASLTSVPFVPPSVIPPERELGTVASLRALFGNYLRAWPRAVYEQRWFAPRNVGGMLFVMDPDALRKILLDDAENFPQAVLLRRAMRPVWGEGLFTAQGANWRWQRQTAAPAFRPDPVRGLVPAMTAAAERAIARWRELARFQAGWRPVDRPESAPDLKCALGDGAQIELFPEMARITFDLILNTMLSGGEGLDVAAVGAAVHELIAAIGRPSSVADLLGLPDWIAAALPSRTRRSVAILRGAVGPMVARRRAQGPGRGDLVELLTAGREAETGRAMTDAELRDNIIGFIAAGHETTAVALTWTLYLIASHKPTAARIREEIRRVAGEAPIGSEQIERLQFTRQVVQEAMRLYAPGPQLARTCTRDIEICGRPVTAGTLVLIPIFALHRHRLHWSDPDAFDPDRFAPALGAERRRYVYMPFGAGPRICIGSHFAMTEAVAILATLVRAVDVEPGRADAVEPVGGASLRPAGGLRLRLRFRPPITPRTASAAPS